MNENTRRALDRSRAGSSDSSLDETDLGSTDSFDGDDGSFSRPRDANGNGVLDSIEPYQSDPADTLSPTQDNGRTSPRDWNANTDTIDPVSENTLDALDGANESNAFDASPEETDATSGDTTTGGTTTGGTTSGGTTSGGTTSGGTTSGGTTSGGTSTGDTTSSDGFSSGTTTGTTDSSFDPRTTRRSATGSSGASTSGDPSSLRSTGSTSRRSASTTSSQRQRTVDLDADVNVDASVRTPGLQRAARLLGNSGGQNSAAGGLNDRARGLDRARTRASSNAQQGLDRATDRTQSNLNRFRDRFDLDE